MVPRENKNKVVIPKWRIENNYPSSWEGKSFNGTTVKSPPGACTWKIALKYKVKQSKNSKFTSNYKASQIDLETQLSLCR